MKYIIIKGITASGEDFRPSDWAERLSARMAVFKGKRMLYSPNLQPTMIDGYKCLMMSETLATQEPDLYCEILAFADQHHLQIEEQCVE